MRNVKAARYLLFIIINPPVVFTCLYLGVPGKNLFSDPGFISMFAVATGIILLQYPFLFTVKNWWLKLAVFYLSMVTFLALWGIFMSWNQAVGSHQAGTCLARIDGAGRVVLLGHLFGIWFLPVIVFVNWLLRRKLFFEQQSKKEMEPIKRPISD